MLIGFSGRKQSGKNTCANYLVGKTMAELGLIHGPFAINDKGELEVPDIKGKKSHAGVFDINRNTQPMHIFREVELNAYVRVYSFADILKRDVCIKILGLSYEQCYGTDEQKNSATHIKWDDVVDLLPHSHIKDIYYNSSKIFLSAREVMQIIGTDIFRRLYNNVWVDSLLKEIHNHPSELSIITDVRFPNEVDGVLTDGGIVIRLTRMPFPQDTHLSEISLDKEAFDWSKFTHIIDNANMTISEQLQVLEQCLTEKSA